MGVKGIGHKRKASYKSGEMEKSETIADDNKMGRVGKDAAQ